ncbi:MAG: lysylphosphatidylglycerol synthase transmembrane domain-containing protein [bacterium]
MRTLLLRILRIVVSGVLLFWVLEQAHLREIGAVLAGANFWWIVAAFLVNSAGNGLGAWRWQLLLRSQGRRIPILQLTGSYFVGLFFNMFLPSTIGGDVARATSAKRRGGGTLTENLTVVLVERLIGLQATLALGGIAAVTGVAGRIDPRLPFLLLGLLLLALAGLLLALNAAVRRLILRLAAGFPIEFVRNTVGKMLAAFELFSRARGTLLANFALSLAFQFLLIVHFWLVQFAFRQAVPFSAYVAIVPVVFCVMMLPISINGLGVRESAFVWFLTRAGMDPASAAALSLSSFAIALAQGVFGSLVHLGRESRSRGADPIVTGALRQPGDSP